jgi:Sel1 repeat-containing protein
MSTPNDAARLREIQRLLERIQQLPHVAGLPGNGLANGYHELPMGPAAAPGPPHDLIAPLPERVVPPLLLDPPEREHERHDLPRALVALPEQRVSNGIAPWVFVVATAVNTVIAAVLAVAITLGMARRDQPPAAAEKVAPAPATFRPAAAPPRPEPVLRHVELLPVGSPGEPLRMEALKPARLPLKVRPLEALQEGYILILSGLPANTALSGAARMGADSWLLSPGALQQLEIVLPEWSASTIEVRAELRRTNGAVVAQSRLWLAVPPPPTPQATALSESAIKDMVRSGDKLVSRGDVAAARALYEKAAAMGSAQAALALGSTYDPRRLWSLGVFGMVGNKERAQHWYRRAAELGHPDAKARISALQDR